MTDAGPKQHITVTFREGDAAFTRTYAIDTATLDKARSTGLTGQQLDEWLRRNRCPADSEDGPAYVRQHDDGSRVVQYCRDDCWHRENGPAHYRRYTDGSWEEIYARQGRRHREDGPALVRQFADGSREERFYRNDKLHRDDGPAVIYREADGSIECDYYSEGVFLKAERYAPPSVSGPRTQAGPVPPSV